MKTKTDPAAVFARLYPVAQPILCRTYMLHAMELSYHEMQVLPDLLDTAHHYFAHEIAEDPEHCPDLCGEVAETEVPSPDNALAALYHAAGILRSYADVEPIYNQLHTAITQQ